MCIFKIQRRWIFLNKKSLLRVISLLLAALMAAGSFGLFASADDDDYEPGTPEYCENVLGGHVYGDDGFCVECGQQDPDYDGRIPTLIRSPPTR